MYSEPAGHICSTANLLLHDKTLPLRSGFCRILTLFLDHKIEVPSVPRDPVPRPHLATLQNGDCLKTRSWPPLLSRHLHLLLDEDLSNDGIDIGMEDVKRNRKRAGRSS